jgi:plastocyanin
VPRVGGKRERVAIGGLLGLVMLMGLTGCGGGGSSATELKADVTVDKVDSIHQYDPKKLEISLNHEETFTFLNKDKIVHNVTVPAFAIDMDIQPGQRVDVKIPAVSQAPRDGFFTFYCKYHQAEGEAGRINVSR